jgi:hypothetical protein
MYDKFSESELIEAYTTMIDYSGKANSEMLQEIENRGGLDKFLETIKQKEINKRESDRVLNLIIQYNREGLTFEEINQKIVSEIWTEQHLNAFIENRYIRHQLFLNEKSIDREVISGSILGILIASIAGSAIWICSFLILKSIFYPVLIGIYLICYLIIRGLVGKSRNNIVVFIASFISTIISFSLGFFILGRI